MGYRSEINIIQNPYFKENQLVELYNHLIEDGWSASTKFDSGAIQYSIKSGDWLELPKTEIKQFEDILSHQSKNASWTCFMLNNEQLERIVWIYQHENDFSIELQIASNDKDELIWFEKFHNQLIQSIKKLQQVNHIEWRTGYDNELIRIQTSMNHEGVLCLCSSNQLKKYYSNNEFNYEYPQGLYELFKQKIAFVIDSKDYEYDIILEIEKITEWRFGLYNEIKFTKNDELLILHHGDFTMICDNHNGNHQSYGWKNIISIPIEKSKDQVMLIAKPKDEEDKRLIIQFRDIDRKLKKNSWIEYEGIPTHNKWS